MMENYLQQFLGEVFAQVITYIIYFSPIWLPVLLTALFWQMWVVYVRNDFFSKQKYTLLEIKLPTEITKSPVAMEVIISSMWELAGETTFFDRWWDGKTRPTFSLELASIGGDVKFFIWGRASYKDYIEARIYSQYPTVEVHEVADYTQATHLDPSVNDLWSCHFTFTNKKSIYPIRTYLDWGLEKDPKEEFKVDPITPILEFLGSLKPGEQAWYQFVIHTHKAEDKHPTKWFKKVDWQFEAKEEVKSIVKDASVKPEEQKEGTIVNLTEGQRRAIDAIERRISKPAFNVGMRAIYIADKKAYNKTNQTGLSGAFRQVNSGTLNGFKPTDITSFNYPWMDFRGKNLLNMKKERLYRFKKRAFFFRPHREETILVMNSEELATIYHFPGAVAGTPNLTRIPSKTSQAPSNLPV